MVYRKTPAEWGQVVEQIRRGSRSAEETLYAELHSGARFFLRRCNCGDQEDDLVHDLFLTVVQSIRSGTLRDPDRLMGFVRTVLFRLAARHKATGQAGAITPEDIQLVPASEPDPEQSCLQRQKVELMRQVLRELRARDLEIVKRFYLQGQTEEQIRREMGLTATQFRLLKCRAKSRFAVLMQRRLESPASLSQRGSGRLTARVISVDCRP